MRRGKHEVATAVIDEISKGLSARQKTLPSWFFYDGEGDRIFQEIMNLPEYYPTQCELKILQENRELLLAYFLHGRDHFNMIELGAGDGVKTQVLLDYFSSVKKPFHYIPVDISDSVLTQLTHRLSAAIPDLQISPKKARYENALAEFHGLPDKVILFLGANIGNYSLSDAQHFIKNLAASMAPGDLLVVGFDLKKNPRVIQRAYDDERGVTARFNLNLLRRLNEELGANFDLDSFVHYPVYNPGSGAAESYLVSTKKQGVYIDAIRRTFYFEPWETIHTEVSQKYDQSMISSLASTAGLEIVDVLFDPNKYFCDVVFRKGEEG